MYRALTECGTNYARRERPVVVEVGALAIEAARQTGVEADLLRVFITLTSLVIATFSIIYAKS